MFTKIVFAWVFGGALCVLVSAPVLSGPINDQQEVTELRAKIDDFIMSMEGITAVGTAACNPDTGKRATDYDKIWVYCMSVYAGTQESKEALKTLFPSGGLVDGVYIIFDFMGMPVPNN